MAKKNRASKADVQTTELNKLPVPEDAEFATELSVEGSKQQKKNKNRA